jgi:holliday junction DNA helicase RuvA
MIGYLAGAVLELHPGEVLLDVGGVGYEVRVPVSAHATLSGQQHVTLHVHTHVREDQLALYGFPTRRERDTFRQLISVSGVGPRTALAVLSGLTPDDLAAAIEGEQWRRLASVPGIGKRTAERLVVELRGKLAVVAQVTGGSLRDDAVSALANLGYNQRAAEDVVSEIARNAGGIDLGELLRRALQTLSR